MIDLLFYLAALLLNVAPFWVWLAVGSTALFFARWLWKRRSGSVALLRIGRSFLIGMLLFLAGILLFSAAYQVWYTHRSLPAALQQDLFRGISYIRDLRREPRPLVIHVLKIRLKARGLRFLVTPGNTNEQYPLEARTTSQFLTEFGLQIAVNGDFFEPWWSNGIFDYYPHVGDRTTVTGFASSEGKVYSQGRGDHQTLYLSSENQAQFDKPTSDKIFNAISGNYLFIENGLPILDDSPYHNDPHPRTVAALDFEHTTLLLIVVDGRQPNYSEGVSMAELAEITVEYGGYTALNLDGGGSTTLVVQGTNGEPLVLNSPIDQRIPGRERPIANHLGIYVGSAP